MSQYHSDRCCNPFRKVGEKGHIGKDLRVVFEALRVVQPDIPKKSKICQQCRKIFLSTENCASKTSNNGETVDQNETEESISSPLENIEILKSAREIELEELLAGLKEKYNSLDENDPLRVTILTIAPMNWSIRKIAIEFNTSRRMAKKGKELRESQGILARSLAKSGKILPINTVENVKKFYNSDLNSRLMPGKRDSISVKVENKRTLIQKRLLLLGLKELYVKYIDCYKKEHYVGFSTFAKLRPKYCILAGGSGTHSVCVCIIHQNCKLLLDAIDVENLTKQSEMQICNYKDCLKQITCKESTSNCYLDNCKHCPSIETFSTTF